MKDKLWFFCLLLVVATTALYQRAPLAEASQIKPFRLEAGSGEVSNPENLPIEVVRGPADHQALLKINLNEYRSARIRVPSCTSYPPLATQKIECASGSQKAEFPSDAQKTESSSGTI